MSIFENLRPFQVAMYFGFGLLMVIAVILLNTADIGGGTSGPTTGPVAIWGTLDANAMQATLAQVREDTGGFRDVTYQQISPDRFDQMLVDAIVERRPPDIILIPQRKLVEHRSKILPINYEFFSQRRLRDEYIDGFEIFARPNGLYAIPFVADPLILYWNRDIFASNGLAQPPRTWEDVTGRIVPDVVRRGLDRTVTQSPIAFGFYENNRNAFASLSMLLLQSGSQMVEEQNGQYRVSLNSALPGGDSAPLVGVARFYTRFADAGDPLYSWNRNKREDRQEFLSESLALYFGMGSEFSTIQRQNPNLNFDVAPVPQAAGATTPRTYGDFYGFAILQTAPNMNGAYQVAQTLGNERYTAFAADRLQMAPGHRSTIARGTGSTLGGVVFNAALIARGWLNPASARTEQAFDQMVRDIQANRTDPARAASDLQQRLRQAF